MPAVPRLVTDLNTVPEALRPFYKKHDSGGFALDSDPDPRLDEYRENNRGLNRQVEELKTQMKKFEGIDPERYQKASQALEELEKLRGKKLLDEGKVEEYLTERTVAMRSSFEQQTQQLQSARDAEKRRADNFYGQLATLKIDSAVQSAIGEIAIVRAGAMTDVLARARRDWVVDEAGNLKAADNLLDSHGDRITTMKSYAQHLLVTAPYLFEGARGGGAGGGNGGAGGDGIRRLKEGSRMTAKDLADIRDGKAIIVGA